jgi:hypothetical protein
MPDILEHLVMVALVSKAGEIRDGNRPKSSNFSHRMQMGVGVGIPAKPNAKSGMNPNGIPG